MAQSKGMGACSPEDLSSIPRPTKGQERTDSRELSPDLHTCVMTHKHLYEARMSVYFKGRLWQVWKTMGILHFYIQPLDKKYIV